MMVVGGNRVVVRDWGIGTLMLCLQQRRRNCILYYNNVALK